MTIAADLPDICHTVAPSRKTGPGQKWRRNATTWLMTSASAPSHPPHAVAVMVMDFAFHTEDPDGVGDAIHIFLFPYLSPSVGSEVALRTRKCDVILGGRQYSSVDLHVNLVVRVFRFSPLY